MRCPKCSYIQTDTNHECQSCGVFFNKLQTKTVAEPHSELAQEDAAEVENLEKIEIPGAKAPLYILKSRTTSNSPFSSPSFSPIARILIVILLCGAGILSRSHIGTSGKSTNDGERGIIRSLLAPRSVTTDPWQRCMNDGKKLGLNEAGAKELCGEPKLLKPANSETPGQDKPES